jgi:N-methylhydantoinase A
LHAAALAGELGIERVLCPMASGVLSALGLAAAAPRRDAARTVMLAGAAFGADAIAGHCRQLSERLQAELGGAVERVRVRYELRYTGQSFELAVDEEQQSTYADPETLRARFEQAHELRYGFRQPELEVELVTIRLSAWGAAPRAHVAAVRGPLARERRTAVFGGAHFNADCWIGVPEVGAHVAGPAVCALPESTVLVPPGWSGTVDERGTIALERSS